MQTWLHALELIRRGLGWKCPLDVTGTSIITEAIDTGAIPGSVLSEQKRRVDLKSKTVHIFKEHLEEKHAEEGRNNIAQGSDGKLEIMRRTSSRDLSANKIIKKPRNLLLASRLPAIAVVQSQGVAATTQRTGPC